MSFKKKLSIGLAIAAVIIGCLLLFLTLYDAQSSDTTTTTTTNAAAALAAVPPRPTENVDGIDFELSTTTAEQQQGLSDRTDVPDNYAMLFVFPEDGQYGFWMKDMDVPLDMVWLSDDGTIASITPNIPVDSYPNVFYPPEPIKYVLEVRAGFALEKGWTVGTHIHLPLPYGE